MLVIVKSESLCNEVFIADRICNRTEFIMTNVIWSSAKIKHNISQTWIIFVSSWMISNWSRALVSIVFRRVNNQIVFYRCQISSHVFLIINIQLAVRLHPLHTHFEHYKDSFNQLAVRSAKRFCGVIDDYRYFKSSFSGMHLYVLWHCRWNCFDGRSTHQTSLY